ncbi:cell adhesion molecule CEACAM5-like isoform 2-T2 [Pholidichthys leucotaenia]
MSESTTFVQLLGGLILIVTGVLASCPIEVSPPRVAVKHGSRVSVNCSTTTNVPGGIGWEASQGGTGVETVAHLSWIVESLTVWDISPMCFYSVSNSDIQCHMHTDVIVYTFPERISINSSSSSNAMTERKKYNFTCDIPHIAPLQNLTVVWYKGDEIIHTDNFPSSTKKPVAASPQLHLLANRSDNGARFRCEAHMDLTSAGGPKLNVSSENYSITVNYGPDIQCADVSLWEGYSLESTCNVSGNPTPSVRWLKDGQPINVTRPLNRKHSGTYTIEAKGASTVQKKIEVVVFFGPELECPTTYTVDEFSPNNLLCNITGHPKPETVWFKDDEEVEPPENLTRSDTGQYVIMATNHHSIVNRTVDINVLYPPSQIFELEDSEGEAGSTVSLKCSSVGNPTINYTWTYYHTDNVIERNEDGVSLLIINNATGYNRGSYSCHVWNEKGRVSKMVKVTVKGAQQECPIEITEPSMVVRYQSQVRPAQCKSTSAYSTNVKEIYWQSNASKTTFWSPDTHNGWDLDPVCIAEFNGIGTCQKSLSFTLYKTPDSVSVYVQDNSSSVVEGKKFELRCDIINVAPAQNLTVEWYQGNKAIGSGTTECWHGNIPDCSGVRSPVNVSSNLTIVLNRNHSGVQFRCEARLDLGAHKENMTSSPLNITVLCYLEELVCEADGHPPPTIQWLNSSDKSPREEEGKLIVSEPGVYICKATNDVNTTLHEVQLILTTDYLPLIAGLVAATVVIISIIFVFFYSIYYKNTKTNSYDLKKPNLSTHNGNVAHNGWDLPLPMTKMS